MVSGFCLNSANEQFLTECINGEEDYIERGLRRNFLCCFCICKLLPDYSKMVRSLTVTIFNLVLTRRPASADRTERAANFRRDLEA